MLIKLFFIMTATIVLDTREFIDLMNPPRLDNAADIVLSQDRERDEFKRTVEDVKLRVSDMSNELTALFRSYPITSNWEVNVIDDGRQLFRGRIERPIRSDVIADWLEIQSFSKNKDFWEKCKVTQILKDIRYPFIADDEKGSWMSPENIIRGNCDRFIPEGLFKGYTVDSLYADRRIAFSRARTSNGNSFGWYGQISPDMSLFDLLTAISKYYNAEIFIDPETDNLTMLRRNAIQNDVEHDLDDIVLNDEEIYFDDTDARKYDYLHAVVAVEKPLPILKYEYNRYPISANYEPTPIELYCYTNIFAGSIESEPSDLGGYAYEYYPSESPQKWKYAMVLPKPSADVTAQRIYVKSENKLLFVKELTMGVTYNEENIVSVGVVKGGINVDGILFIDRISTIDDRTPGTNTTWLSGDPVELEVRKATGDIWWKYDEENGSWSSILGYDGELQPQGNVFEILPKITFYNRQGEPVSAISDTFNFFGRETNLSTFAQQWTDFFISKGKVYCSVKNIAYRIGDSFVTSKHPKIPAGKYVMKKGRHQLMRERTQIELIKV